jgi:hypothetical protein
MTDDSRHQRFGPSPPSPIAIDRVVRALYGETAALDPSGRHWMLATILGGRGDACRIERASGAFHDASERRIEHQGDLIDAAALVLGLDRAEAAHWISARGGIGDAQRGTVVSFPAGRAMPANRLRAPTQIDASSDHTERLRARLLASPTAMAHLTDIGLSAQTIQRFHLGLSEPQPVKNAGGRSIERTRSAITVPVIGPDGLPKARMIKITPAGSGVRAAKPAVSCPGGAATYWSAAANGAADLLVVSRVTDLWRVAQALEKTHRGASTIIIASSRPDEIPAEWLDPDFWQRWRQVYIACAADTAGTELRERIRRAALRDLMDVAAPGTGGWVEFFLSGGTAAQFEELLAKARPASAPFHTRREPMPLETEPDGFYGVEPININAAWSRGHLYYPVWGRETASIPTGRAPRDEAPELARVYRFRARVVRSDGTILDCVELPAPSGTSRSEHVIALSDGTIITAMPRPREFATWRWESIECWKAARDAGEPPHRPLRELLAEVQHYIEHMIWLPLKAESALLAAYVAMTFVFPVFDAVPNLLINGAKGSGKSTAGRGLAGLSFNGFVLGAGSGDALIRFVDQGRGLLVLDDLEKVGRNVNANGYGELNQLLKLSYSKTESKKSIGEGGQTRLLDFFGPKVVTNISGIDQVNASRMFRIAMRTMPPEIAEAGLITGPDQAFAEPLRQELHAWGMTAAQAVSEIYRTVLATRSTRFDEICAPIRTIVRAADDPEFEQAVEEALRRQDPTAQSPMDRLDCLEAAVASCVRRSGGSFISLAEVQLALALMLEKTTPEAASDLTAAPWLGRKMRELGLVEAEAPARRRLYGTITKIYRVRPEFQQKISHATSHEGAAVREGLAATEKELEAFVFCEGRQCRDCPYLSVCESVCPGLKEAKQVSRGASARRQSLGASARTPMGPAPQ